MNTFEPATALHESVAAHLDETGLEVRAGEREGTVSDHHLDDVGASVNDLPDQHSQGRGLLLTEDRTSRSPAGLIGEPCSPGVPVPQRPPCSPA